MSGTRPFPNPSESLLACTKKDLVYRHFSDSFGDLWAFRGSRTKSGEGQGEDRRRPLPVRERRTESYGAGRLWELDSPSSWSDTRPHHTRGTESRGGRSVRGVLGRLLHYTATQGEGAGSGFGVDVDKEGKD